VRAADTVLFTVPNHIQSACHANTRLRDGRIRKSPGAPKSLMTGCLCLTVVGGCRRLVPVPELAGHRSRGAGSGSTGFRKVR
jgi:hypothetical protein